MSGRRPCPLRAPDMLDGAPLGPAGLAYYQHVLDVVYGQQPLRPTAALLAQAQAVFRISATCRDGAWHLRRSVRLDGGRGPAVTLRVSADTTQAAA